jgi:hypothetical protein
VTVTIAERETVVAPAALQASVKVLLGSFSGAVAAAPEVGLLPDHAPLAVHDVAFTADQVRFEVAPLATLVGVAEKLSEISGVAGGGAGGEAGGGEGEGAAPSPPPPQAHSTAIQERMKTEVRNGAPFELSNPSLAIIADRRRARDMSQAEDEPGRAPDRL